MKAPAVFLKEWMDAVNSADLDGILAMYAPNAVLIPTFSNRLLTEPVKIRDYFERVFSREELSIALHEKTFAAHALQDSLHTLHGIYCWRFAVDGEILSFEARFSYVVDLQSARPILHHHSSQIPRVL